jgi:nucleoside phosphorylase
MSLEQSARVEKVEYTVGWICALVCEFAAAKAMLDEIDAQILEQDPSDHNVYELGRIGSHRVVIACLPAGRYGTNSAAVVAMDMLRTFKSIRIGLMVGIGGGVPSSLKDVRLGDVVVSQPERTFGGVVQYDLGKTTKDSKFVRTGTLSAPPRVLLAAVARLKATHLGEDSQIPKLLSEMLAKKPKMRSTFVYQGAQCDRLYSPNYDHVEAVDQLDECQRCDPRKMLSRPPRVTEDPEIHYGTIASGNQVIKHALTRDRLREEFGALCFEMEAAGLMQDFPCLVIRGICDYADSHKNKRWQHYASATAAAYAKELLLIIPATQVMQERPVVPVTGQ